MGSSKNIVVAVTGGIACYKSCEVIREFKKQGHEIQVILTKAATQFVTELTFQTLSGNNVATDLFDLTQESEIGHIQLADQADVILVCPATANAIAKAALGLADDLLSTVLLATKAPLVFAPSMNVNMYDNPITQNHVQTLKERGTTIIDPEEGDLACGWTGKGRLANPSKIVQETLNLIQ